MATFCNLVTHDGDRIQFGNNPPIPTDDEIRALINVAEEHIETMCNNAWSTRTITITDELQDLWEDHQEFSFALNNPNIVAFDDTEGDKLEIWDGNNWIEWLTTYVEGRDEDFWVDYKIGRIYFINRRPSSGKQMARVTYRYGGSSAVPQAVKMATALFVGIILATGEYASILFPEGTSENFPASSRVTQWEKTIEELLKKYKIGQVPVNLPFVPVRY